jgi:hypothetical protein
MSTSDKTKEQLISELAELRQQISKLEQSETEHKRVEEELKKTKEYLDNVIESSLDCILVTNSAGHITIANKAFLNLLGGYTSEEIIGKHTVGFSPTEEGTYESTTGESVEIGKEFFDSTKAIIQGKFFKEDKISNWETYLIRKDRIVVPVEENLVYLYDDKGNRIGAVGIIRDITERKQIEKTLQESEERLRTLVSNIPGAVYRCDCDPDWTMRFLNMAILEISGYPASDFINNEVRTYASIIHPDDRSFVEKVVFEAIEQKRPYIIEYRIVNAHGNIRWIYEKGQGVFGKNNEVLWLDGVIFDNTDRKKIEEDKTKIEGRLENKVTELSIMNEISEVLLSSRELNEILHMILIGATAYQALGFNRAFLFLINEEETMLEGKVATGSLAIEEAYKIWEGLTHESHTLKELLQSRHGELSKEDEPINNLMKKMKIPLREGETIFTQAVYENKSFNITDGTDNLLIDKDFISLLGTDTFALVPLVSRGKTLGVLLADNFINKKPILDEDVERLGAFANHASLAIENSHLYKSSREKVEELSRAYNELQENRDKLLRYERLSAVGNVAARVTHEIRNPLVAIGGFARRILKKDQDGEANRNYVKIIVEEIDRLENTLTDILSFAKPTLPKCDTVDLNEGIKSILKILDIEITKSNIRTEEHFDPALPMLWLDENQIRRVVINLIRNAIQAMPDGGTIIISTSREDQWVKVEIADTGVGISDEDISKLFDAFFTSKSTGSGLGLTVSAQIINNHGGTIEVQKREPQGTLFIIRLPIKKPSALT